MTIKGKTVLITGGSGGIGAALTKKLLARGARVFSIDRVKPLQAAKNETKLVETRNYYIILDPSL